MTDILILVAIYALSGLVQGLVGFAFAVVAVPLVSLLYSPAVAVGITIVIGPLMMFYNAWLHREFIAFRTVIPLMITALILVPVGAFFLNRMPETLIMVTLGAVVILMTLLSTFAAERTNAFLALPGVGYAFASLSGFITGAFIAGGPPIVAYLYNSDDNRLRAKANAQLFFTIGSIAALAIHLTIGTVTAHRALRAVPCIPIAFICVRLGSYLSSRLPTRVFRWVTDVAIVALGVYLIATNL